MANKGNILIVVTSQHQMGDSQKLTGFHFEEMSTPYYIFEDNGFNATIASIKGGRPPHDPNSLKEEFKANPESVQRFLNDEIAQEKLSNTPPIASIDSEEYLAVYLPGGHGTMWDFPQEESLTQVIENFYRNDKVIAAICHGPAGLINAKKDNGEPIVKGKRVNSFTDDEEIQVGLDGVVPFLLETKLRELGGKFEKADKFESCVVKDGMLITGQNPASAVGLAQEVVKAMETSIAEPA